MPRQIKNFVQTGQVPFTVILNLQKYTNYFKYFLLSIKTIKNIILDI